jgi:hypothetical protein
MRYICIMMRNCKTLIWLCFFVGLSPISFAQKSNTGKSTYTRTRFNHNTAKVKGSKAKIICPVFDKDEYPYHGLGFKLGDPFALTYKFYINKYFSLAADVGKASSGLYSRYFHDRFSEYVMPDTLRDGATFNFLSSKIKSDWVGELKFLYSFDAKRISKGLQVYAGIGLQAKSTQLQYVYLYDYSNNVYPGQFDRRRPTLGQTTIVGIEYSNFNLPISAFIEVELYTDIMRDPGWQRFQGGAGLRYIF